MRSAALTMVVAAVAVAGCPKSGNPHRGESDCAAFARQVAPLFVDVPSNASRAEQVGFHPSQMGAYFRAEIRCGCEADDRVAEFPEVVACLTAARTASEAEACPIDTYPEFKEYMVQLMDSRRGATGPTRECTLTNAAGLLRDEPWTPASHFEAVGAGSSRDPAKRRRRRGAVSCDDLADHLQATFHRDVPTSLAPDELERRRAFAVDMTERIRIGCRADDRLADYPDAVSCIMAAESKDDWDACAAGDEADAFDRYMRELMDAP